MSVLVFSVAVNGFEILFRRYLRSQRAYAHRLGYSYAVFRGFSRTISGRDAGWLKIPLTLEAFKRGYEKVLFVDADCEVMGHAPAIESIVVPDRFLYLARGPSGRFNTGVFLAVNHPETIALLERILSASDEEIPLEDQTAYENGHVIHYTKNSPIVQVMSNDWNDYSIRDGSRFIQHWGGSARKPLSGAFLRAYRLLHGRFRTDGSRKDRLKALVDMRRGDWPSGPARTA